MKTVEENLWNYIDGNCTSEERVQISALIVNNNEYSRRYHELLQLNNEFNSLELDEPSMSFQYKVMEQIRATEASVPLKASINKRIIWGIAGFFIVTISAILIYTMSHINWSANHTAFQLPEQLQGAELRNFVNGPWMRGVLFFDVVLGLSLLDSYLRKHVTPKNNLIYTEK